MPRSPEERHPNLSREINDRIAESLIEGGAELKKLAAGRVLVVTTRNTVYRIERAGDDRRDYPFIMSGHPRICPTPRRASISGSSWGGAMLRHGFIGREMQVEFSIENNPRPYMTTPVESITEEPAAAGTAGER